MDIDHDNDVNHNDDFSDSEYHNGVVVDEEPLRRAIRQHLPDYDIHKLIQLHPMAPLQIDIYGRYPLHLACKNVDYSNVVMKLIEVFPFAVNQVSAAQRYPLLIAIENRQSERVVMRLIELFPMAVQHIDNRNYYPLVLAMFHPQFENVLMKLLELFPTVATVPITKIYRQSRYQRRSKNREFLLHLACSRRQSDKIIRKIIEINPLALQEKDCSGFYPIHCAINEDQSKAVIKLLMDADPLSMQRQYMKGNNPLRMACYKNDLELVQYMIPRSGRFINLKDVTGKTALHYACGCFHNSCDEVVEKLLQSPDIDFNARDNCGRTPLHIISSLGLRRDRRLSTKTREILSVVHKLLHHPFICINVKDHNNQTPLDMIQKNIKEKVIVEEIHLFKDMKQLLDEFTVKRRWSAYQYFLKNFYRLIEKI